MNKNPKTLKPLAVLSESARRNLNLERCEPRKREPGEATSVVICNARTKGRYVTGDGESRHVSVRRAM